MEDIKIWTPTPEEERTLLAEIEQERYMELKHEQDEEVFYDE